MEKHILLAHPRTASHLLLKILNLPEQKDVQPFPTAREGYFFLPTMYVRMGPSPTYGRPVSSLNLKDRERLMTSYQKSFDAMDKFGRDAERKYGIVYLKEHVPWLMDPVHETRFLYPEEKVEEAPWMVWAKNWMDKATRNELNETVLPDQVLGEWMPTFLIRHPALVFPSLYRTSVDLEGAEKAKGNVGRQLEMTYHWSRMLFDFYLDLYAERRKQKYETQDREEEKDISWPVVLDADDVMLSPEIVIKYAELVGLDTEKLKFEWDAASGEVLGKLGKAEQRMRSTVDASRGIVKGKTARDLDIDVEAKKWQEEFGDEESKKMEKWVRDAMPDYEYLKAQRLRP